MTKGKISRSRALKETYKIFIKIHNKGLPTKPKEAYKFDHGCACCQYVKDRHGCIGPVECESCPLLGLWPHGCERTMVKRSHKYLYSRTPWEQFNLGGNISGAKKIADHCLKLILK